ncbi:MAG TPA: hypothetical protein VLN58_02960, partial [Verrucomicrobiae bacterium]|nr:hypothetical protein [Verrucomicrobiae bacterium]
HPLPRGYARSTLLGICLGILGARISGPALFSNRRLFTSLLSFTPETMNMSTDGSWSVGFGRHTKSRQDN